MSISILCPSCKKKLKAPDDAGGKKVKCPQCGTGISLPIPPVVEEPSPPAPPAIPVRPPTKRGNHVLVFLAVGVAVAGIAVTLVVLSVSGFLWGSKGNEQADVKAQPKNPADEKSGNKNPPVTANADTSTSALDIRQKEEQARLEKKKAEKARLEEERKQAEEAIRNATILQAPPLEKGKYHETGDFGKMMKDLAENEFKIREAKTQVYRSTFDQRTLQSTPILKRFHARNAVVSPGRYDFDSGNYILDLVFWQALYMEKKKPADVVNNPRTNDICLLSATFKVDAKSAQRWREAIDKGTFSLTVWYRLAKVERGNWKQNPHWDPVPMLAHDIAFNIDVVKFEESSSGTVESPKAELKPEQPKETSNPVTIARQTADDYVKSVENKGLLRLAVFAGIYKNPKGVDSYAVCYTVSEVNRKPVTNQPVHVFAFKDNGGEWRISTFSADGVHVALGLPPTGFTKVSAPKAAK